MLGICTDPRETLSDSEKFGESKSNYSPEKSRSFSDAIIKMRGIFQNVCEKTDNLN